jgi:hypothetical protein
MKTAKIVSISEAPSACDYSGIRADCTDLNKIVDNIDDVSGRNKSLREYIYALRDLQHAINRSMFAGEHGVGGSDEDICNAEDAVRLAFDRLAIAQLLLFNSIEPHMVTLDNTIFDEDDVLGVMKNYKPPS